MKIEQGKIISSINMSQGIRYWRDEKPKWPQDFHNQFYIDLAILRKDGITEQWWRAILQHLRGWRAVRPLRPQTILVRGLSYLDALRNEYEALRKHIEHSESTFATLRWEDVAGLYEIAHSIKGVKPPVFGSKLCHFLIPEAFPVIDGDAVGLRGYDYMQYWQYCQEQWEACDDKEDLTEQLRVAINHPVSNNYPWGPKITEICLIGQRVSVSEKSIV
jgi:hypothetical protein